MMTLAHISDLHIGKSPHHLRILKAIRDRICALKISHVLVTGDVTEDGTRAQYDQFKAVFSDFFDTGRITVLPGNHDRLGNDVAKDMQQNQRVHVTKKDGLYLVAVDSTAPHNRYRFMSHGKIDQETISQVEQAVAKANPTDTVIVALHHHILPQPEDLWIEKVATFLHLPMAKELHMAEDLLHKLIGHCDLVLHGHRHATKETEYELTPRKLRIFNAGASTILKKFRVFDVTPEGKGSEPVWVEV